MRRATLIALGLAILLLGAAVPATAGLRNNPADNPRLLRKPIEPFRYDYADHCADRPKSGTLALKRWLERNVRGESWGIMRCARLGSGHYSLHSEGRAIDWHLDARIRRDKRAARRLIHVLLERDRRGNDAALARRMGVQGIIFNCHAWWAGMDSMGPYSYCFTDGGRRRHGLDPTQAHRNHVHIELNLPGARERTSFWRSPLSRR